MAVVGSWIAVDAIEHAFQQTLKKKLRAITASTAKSVALWSEQQILNARILAEDDRTEGLVSRLISSHDAKPPSELRSQLSQRLTASSRHLGFASFTVIDYSGETITTNARTRSFDESQLDEFSQVFCGETVFAEPSNRTSEDHATPLYVATPIQARRGQEETIATLVCEIPSDGSLQRTLAASAFGQTGRNSAIDRTGKPLTSTASNDDPFVHQLISATSEGDEGIVLNVEGFIDDSGQHLVGGAKLLSDFGIGVVSTIDYGEAYASHNLFKRINSVVTSLALLGSLIGLVYTWHLSRAQFRAMKAERQLRNLGQYSLEEKVGEGGMGEVYRASHRMLRRPTAVKLLPAEKSSPQAIERFEREVQLTAQLTHPNTISIYDYGRTANGVFYYAMEFLDGVDLKKLVEHEGAQPEARVIHILRQICGSLEEAHSRGLVHRDIKPANVIVCQRGGQFDVAKLLDFGLVYDVKSLELSMIESGINGTPAFMSPESIESPTTVDRRSDIYSLGAVAYFLLTGTYPFSGSSVGAIWQQQLENEPEVPSRRTSKLISPTLEALILRCLAVDPIDRPRSIGEVLELLGDSKSEWTQQDAEARWSTAALPDTVPQPSVVEQQPAETLVFSPG